MPVVLVDLRDRDVRARMRGADHPELIGAMPGELADLPVRLLAILPIDHELVDDAEQLALALLGMDPAPRCIAVAVLPAGRSSPPDQYRIERRLPLEFGRHPGVRFLDFRASALSIGHPRTGIEQIGTGAPDPWAETFVADLIGQLLDRSIFDAIWAAIPPERPATLGMRVATIGEGRELAVADLALRLADELRPDREPEMGQLLPERWSVDQGLLPEGGHAEASIVPAPAIPRPVQGLADVSRRGLINALKRSPAAYNEASADATRLLQERPTTLKQLFVQAEARRGEAGGPFVDPVGAADLDDAVGGVIFGDPVAESMDGEQDPAQRVGEQLEVAAGRQGDGLSAAVLIHWLRTDADAVQPVGPAAVGARLGAETQPWATLGRDLSRPRGAGDSAGDALPARDLRPGLRWVLGSRIWRRRSIRLLYLFVATLLVLISIAQAVADRTGLHPLSYQDLGIDPVTGVRLQAIANLVAIVLLGYLVVSLVVAVAVRRWAKRLRFADVPRVLGELHREARWLAVAEVARTPARREYARVARAAAETLERAATDGSEAARGFGQRLAAEVNAAGSQPSRSPYRDVVTPHGVVAGTDAGGLYRIYPRYVEILRAAFAQALLEAIRERWPRVRGVFWADTSASISALACGQLQDRLERVRAVGLRRGDLVRDGVDPADELAESLWRDPAIRQAALTALRLGGDEAMPILAMPAEARLLDATVDGELIVAVPATLEPLVRETAALAGGQIVVTDALETATALRVFPFIPGLYDISDFASSREVSPR